MSDLKQIRKRLNNYDKIERLLESIGCEYVKPEQRGELITAQLPERFHSNNKRAVQVRLNDSLYCNIRNRGDFKGGSIFDLISYIHFDKRGEKEFTNNLYKSKEYICKLFGWNEYLKGYKDDVVVKDYTASLKEIINGRKRRREVKPNPVIPEDVMQEFYPYGKPLSFQGWIDEGISHRTQTMYGVGFCLQSKRVVFPLRNRFGQLVGVKGRIMHDEDDERKYLYLYRCNNSLEWFNFHYAHPYILMDKKVYIFEAEKSSMMAFDFGVYNTLAIGASDISSEQAEMVKGLGLDIEIVLCYDKDKTVDEVREQAKKFKGRKVYGMFDIDNLFDPKNEKEYKMSPVDKGFKVWNQLVENNIYEIDLEDE